MVSRYVISCSKGLAETTKSSQPTIQFIHESVRDFLIKDKGLYELWPELGFDYESLGHERLKQCCKLYTNHDLIYASVNTLLSKSASNDRQEILTDYPFLEYATQNILYHANAAAKVVRQDEFLSCFPISSWINTSNLFEKSQNRKYTLSANLFYILADKGCPALIRERLKEDPQVHVFGEIHQYPLFAALANGNKDAVAALLNPSSNTHDEADITEGLSHRKGLEEYRNRTPLSWAAQDGRTGIVKILLQTKAICDELDGGGRTPLSRASSNGHDAVARLLIDNGADVNTSDDNGWTPLQSAIYNGHEAVAKLLIDKAADVNASDNMWTALQMASSRGHQAVARLLVDNGADVNTLDRNGRTPLQLALKDGCEGIARLLIDNGTQVERVN